MRTTDTTNDTHDNYTQNHLVSPLEVSVSLSLYTLWNWKIFQFQRVYKDWRFHCSRMLVALDEKKRKFWCGGRVPRKGFFFTEREVVWSDHHTSGRVVHVRSCVGSLALVIPRWRMLTYSDVCSRMLSYTGCSHNYPLCMLTYTDIYWHILTYTDVHRFLSQLSILQV
jgi:hypothetical protein